MYLKVISSVQLLSHVQLFATLLTEACQTSVSITNFQSLPKLMSIESVMPSNHLILCRPLLLPSVFPRIRVFSNESVLHIRWRKDWSFSFSISPSNEYSGLVSFRMDWLNLPAAQGTLKSLLQHHSSKASILWHSPLRCINIALYKFHLQCFFSFFLIHSGPIKSQFYISTHWETSVWKLLLLFPCMTMVILNSQ